MNMTLASLRKIFLMFTLVVSSDLALAHNNVVVVPLIGNGSELKSLKISDSISRINTLFFESHLVSLGRQTSDRRIVITSITVAPNRYDRPLKPLTLDFCVTADSCLNDPISVPNNKPTTIDFGLGFRPFLNFSGPMFVKILDRGGISEGGTINGITVHVSGYFLDGFDAL